MAQVDKLHFSTREVPVDVEDPRRWCRTHAGHWPVVILDAYEPGEVPAHLASAECFATLRERLSDDGVLAVAVVAGDWNDPIVGSLAATLRTAFPHVIALPTSEPPNSVGSIVLLASDRALELPDEALPQPTDFLLNLEEHWGVVQLDHAWFNRYEPTGSGARVLTDDRSPVDRWAAAVQVRDRAETHRMFGTRFAAW